MADKIKAVWTAGMSPEQAENFKKAFSGSTSVRTRAVELLDRLYTELVEAEESPDFFDKPNVPERLAFNRGQRKVYRRIRELLA